LEVKPKMDVRTKIRKWIEDQRISQTAAAKKIGVPQPTLSQFLAGTRQNLTAEGYWTVALALNTTIDALLDTKVGWPLPPRGSHITSNTEAEQEVIALARLVSQFDREPGKLETAKRRLIELPIGALRAAPSKSK
jgi:predicted XRE-type DNA-binding protein